MLGTIKLSSLVNRNHPCSINRATFEDKIERIATIDAIYKHHVQLSPDIIYISKNPATIVKEVFAGFDISFDITCLKKGINKWSYCACSSKYNKKS